MYFDLQFFVSCLIQKKIFFKKTKFEAFETILQGVRKLQKSKSELNKPSGSNRHIDTAIPTSDKCTAREDRYLNSMILLCSVSFHTTHTPKAYEFPQSDVSCLKRFSNSFHIPYKNQGQQSNHLPTL